MNENDKKVMFSKKSDEWETPQDFYDKLDQEFHFTLDPCATDENHKCKKYYTMEEDGLSKDWGGERVFINPPYSQSKLWIEKAYHQARKHKDTTCVILVPARTDTRYFHEFCMKADEIRFIKGRLKFGGQKNSAPFPSMVVVFENFSMENPSYIPRLSAMERK
jgi:site-specific DNA-methyltransferase (adenine-specific)